MHLVGFIIRMYHVTYHYNYYFYLRLIIIIIIIIIMLLTKHNSCSSHLYVNATDVVKPVDITDILQNTSSLCNNSPMSYHSGLLSSDFFCSCFQFPN